MLLVISCNIHTVRPAEYVNYIEDPKNGLKVEKKVNGITYTLQYQPVNYCVMMEERSFSILQETFQNEYNRFKGLEHYVFRIDKVSMDSLVDKLGDTSKYRKAATEYFDFWIQKDIKIIKGRDTIPCSICQRDANTGISQYYTFSLGFYDKTEPIPAEAQDKQVDRVFIFSNDKLHTGNVALRIKGEDLKRIPTLKI